MKSTSMFRNLLALLCLLSTQAYVLNGSTSGGSAFVVSQQRRAPVVATAVAAKPGMTMMGGSQAKFGVFSPAVYAAKIVLGTPRLNKIRGKAISLHSEKISDFCRFIGAYHLRTRIIKKAKVNGDTLGFLV
eukprot:CAMPEP_0168740660 /NCGR_PEP_ID=MMETSP0724-20121128/12102_1 /TAXON_ID=265536 /ORGANISM="Amphiprora sp., Strain CCMP467" /LENGTH=130 /DNA_ID=CAMNT_0008788119 /DNA_START=41 /DNA_END=433 /DNA_ORIENTATION=-